MWGLPPGGRDDGAEPEGKRSIFTLLHAWQFMTIDVDYRSVVSSLPSRERRPHFNPWTVRDLTRCEAALCLKETKRSSNYTLRAAVSVMGTRVLLDHLR